MIKAEKMIKVLKRRMTTNIVVVISMLFGLTLQAEDNNIYVSATVEGQDTLKKSVEENKETYHVFTHGKPGYLQIDGDWKTGLELAEWLEDKSEGYTRVNIYGCEFGKGEEGMQMVSYLKTQLGKNISASDDITGVDGDWELEVGEPQEIDVNDYNYNLQTCGGVVGGALPTDDFDGDGVCNNLDNDDDNDGVLDQKECNLIDGEFNGTFGVSSGGANDWTRDLQTEPTGGYTYNTTGVLESEYSVIDGYNDSWHPFIFIGLKGHTTGADDDAFLAVNGSASTGVFYSQDISLIAGTTYEISLWAANAASNDAGAVAYPVNLGYRLIDIDGNILYSADTGDITVAETWQQAYLSYTPTTNVEVKFEVYNLSLGTAGNDFAIDDLKFSGCSDDVDGDGIPNNIDLDSDNDGCPDALEGDGGFVFSELTNVGAIGGAIDTDPNSPSYGVPLSAGAGLSLGTAHDSSQVSDECDACNEDSTLFTDWDGDGIGDFCDIDDDNDGIIDCSESIRVYNNEYLLGPHFYNGGTESYAGAGSLNIDKIVDGGTYYRTNGSYGSWDVGSTTDIDPPFEMDFSLPYAIDEVNKFLLYNEAGGAGNAIVDFDVVITENGIEYIESFTATDLTANTSDDHVEEFDLNRSYYGVTGFKLVIYTKAGSSVIHITEVGLNGSSCVPQDTDGDGIPDHKDLDSDGDGCPDALEGGASFVYTDLDTDTSLGDTVDRTETSASYGVPTNAGLGQSVGTSIDENTQAEECDSCNSNSTLFVDTDGDTIGDECDLDDDNDGILDTDEGYCTSVSRYELDPADTVSGATLSANGGNFDLVYNLVSGDPSMGASFKIPFTYSDFDHVMPNANHSWDYIIAKDFSSATFGTENVGEGVQLVPTISEFYNELPENNKSFELTTATRERDMRSALNEGRLDRLGTFSINIGEIPQSGQVVEVLSDEINISSVFNRVVAGPTIYGNIVTAGYFATPQLQQLYAQNTFAMTDPISVPHNETYAFDYTGLSYTGATVTGEDRGLVQLTKGVIEYCNHTDTDGDEIPDYLDLDSDNDGCPDALEGDGDFEYGDLDTDTSLGDTVEKTDATKLGVPTAAGSGQAIGSSQDDQTIADECDTCNVNSTLFADFDNDKIGDDCDLDDDNDGILDRVECVISVEDFNTWDNSNGDWVVYGSGISMYNVVDGAVDSKIVKTINGLSGSDYVNVEVEIGGNNKNNDPNTPSTAELRFKVDGVEYVLFKNTDAVAAAYPIPGNLVLESGGSITPAGFEIKSGTTSYKVRIPWNSTKDSGIFEFSHTAVGDDFTVQNMVIEQAGLSSCDYDGDGISNYQDLDSDNDGCPDALEGDGGFDYGDLVTEDISLGDTVEETDATKLGLPTVAGAGQAIGSSQDVDTQSDECDACNENSTLYVDSDGDEIGDFCDLDDDNDGILDEVECPLVNDDLRTWDNSDGPNWVQQENQLFANLNDADNSRIRTELTDLSGLNKLEYKISIRARNKDLGSTTTSFADLILRINGVEYAKFENTTDTSPVFPIPGNVYTYNGAHITPDNIEVTVSAFTNYTITIPWNPNVDVATVEWAHYSGYDDFLIRNVQYPVSIEKYKSRCDTDGDGISNINDLDSDNDGCPDSLESDIFRKYLTDGTLPDGDPAASTTFTFGQVETTTSAGVGLNGLDDDLETTADSGVYNTAIFKGGANLYENALDNTVNIGCGPACLILNPVIIREVYENNL